jgi:hypothetical protein
VTSLTDRINAVNDLADTISARLHAPLRKQLRIERGFLDETNTYQTESLVITPTPKITNVRPSEIGIDFGNSESSGALRLSALDYIAWVSRSHPKTLFLKSDESRITVYVTDDYGEFECWVLHVDDSDCCYWKLYLRRMYDE